MVGGAEIEAQRLPGLRGGRGGLHFRKRRPAGRVVQRLQLEQHLGAGLWGPHAHGDERLVRGRQFAGRQGEEGCAGPDFGALRLDHLRRPSSCALRRFGCDGRTCAAKVVVQLPGGIAEGVATRVVDLEGDPDACRGVEPLDLQAGVADRVGLRCRERQAGLGQRQLVDAGAHQGLCVGHDGFELGGVGHAQGHGVVGALGALDEVAVGKQVSREVLALEGLQAADVQAQALAGTDELDHPDVLRHQVGQGDRLDRRGVVEDGLGAGVASARQVGHQEGRQVVHRERLACIHRDQIGVFVLQFGDRIAQLVAEGGGGRGGVGRA